ncbi:TPA: hypothetical protein R1612_001244 [Campylobacter jejuni]
MNIVVFGTCHLSWNQPFVSGLKKYHHNIISFSSAHFGPASFLYNLKREKNQDYINNSDLIITAVSEKGFPNFYRKESNNTIIRNYCWFYKELNNLQKKIVLILWYFAVEKESEKYLNFHRYQAKKYGFNLIDTYEYCLQKNILDFFITYYDYPHPLEQLMFKFGEQIALNLQFFKVPKKINDSKDISLITIDIDEMNSINHETSCVTSRSPLYRENIYKITSKIFFQKKYKGYSIVGIYTWNEGCGIKSNSYLVFKNKYIKLAIFVRKFLTFPEFQFNNFIIDEDTCFWTGYELHNDIIKEEQNLGYLELENLEEVNKIGNETGVIGFLLVKDNILFKQDVEGEEYVNISLEYDFTYLCHFMLECKQFIEQYNQRQDPRKLAPLQNQIKEKDNIIFTLNQEKTTLQNKLNSLLVKKQRLELANLEQDLVIKKLESKKLAKSLGLKMSIINPKITFIQANSAKARIQNHLSYKLGQALIENSKSIFGYIRIPYVLSYIKDKHKFEQKAYEEKIKENPNLALPPLETYPDYNEALKEKECFTYKLGEAFIKANKNWYGGGISSFTSKMCLG